MKEKVFYFGKQFISHELISGSSLIFIGTIFSNFFAFLFNLFVVRSLTYTEYGEYATLLSIITLASIPAQSIIPVVVQYSSRFFNKKDSGSLNEFYFQASRALYIIGFLIILLFIAFSSVLQHFFHISTLQVIIFSGIIVSIVYIAIPNTAFFQGLLRFDFLALSSALSGFLKLVAGIVFIYIGWRITGALGAVFVSFFIPFLLGYIPLSSHISFRRTKKTEIPIGEILKYGFPVIVSVFCLSSFTSIDLLLVKHFFNGHDAGLYGGLSLVGRIIFYFTAPISTVMFPLVIKRYEEKRNFHMLFYLALGLVLLPSLLLTVIYFLFPKLVITIFLGGKGYQAIASYLGFYGIFLSLFSITNVLVTFFLSLKQTKVVILLILATLMQVLLIAFFHKNFWQVINSSIFTVLVLFVLLLLYYTKKYAYKKNLQE